MTPADPVDHVERAVAALAGRQFTAEDLRQWVGDVSHPNGWGGYVKAAAARGEIIFCGYTKATRKQARGHLLRLWRFA